MKGLGVKPDPLGQEARYWVGHSKQEIHSERETRRRLSLSLDRGREGQICEVLEEDGVQVCTSHNHVFLPIQLPRVLLVCLAIIYIQELIYVTNCYLFLQVKNKP
jgi:hypothetical protein